MKESETRVFGVKTLQQHVTMELQAYENEARNTDFSIISPLNTCGVSVTTPYSLNIRKIANKTHLSPFFIFIYFI